MDPVTLIVTALAAGGASALQDDAKGAVKTALARLRALAKNRLSARPTGEFVLAQHEQARMYTTSRWNTNSPSQAPPPTQG
jgi:hypothetical protein